MKNGKAARTVNVVPEIVKVAGESGVDMIIELVNQITVGVLLAEWQLNTIPNGCKRKGDAL